MPMTSDEHNLLLEELLNTELEHSRRTEILQTLRSDYNVVISDFTNQNSQIEKLTKDNSELVISNSMLFRSAGITNNDTVNEEVEQQEFSETVTVDELLKNAEDIYNG